MLKKNATDFADEVKAVKSVAFLFQSVWDSMAAAKRKLFIPTLKDEVLSFAGKQ
jgi:hypothetical protein